MLNHNSHINKILLEDDTQLLQYVILIPYCRECKQVRLLNFTSTSLVFTSVHRRSRLIFDTPEPVAPPLCEGKSFAEYSKSDFQRMPSWVEKRDDPFGADTFIPPLRIPSSSAGASSVSSAICSNTTSSHSDSTSANSEASSRSRVSGNRTAHETAFESHASERKRIAGSANRADTCSLPRQDYPHVFAKPPVIPMPVAPFAGTNTMPMLCTLTKGVLVNRIPHGTSLEGTPVTVAVALPGRTNMENKKRHVSKHRSRKRGYYGLSQVDIPLSPFDPFGEPCDLRAAGDGISGLRSIEVHQPQNIVTRTAVGSAPDERVEDGNDADDEGVDARMGLGDVYGDNETEVGLKGGEKTPTKYLGLLFNALSKVKRKDTDGALAIVPANTPETRQAGRSQTFPFTPSIHHSFLGLHLQADDAMHGRRTRSEHALNLFHNADIGDSSQFSSGVGILEEKDIRSGGEAKQAQSKTADDHTNSADSANAPVSQNSHKQEPTQHKSIRKSVMGKLRKLGHLKKRSK
ncbi:hypothetical protein ACEPAF_1347 [Sanghuangporus sanghuang]